MTPEDKLITKHVKTINKCYERIDKLEVAVDWWQEHIRLPLTGKSTTVWTAERVMDLAYKNGILADALLKYGGHQKDCSYTWESPSPGTTIIDMRCSCGFEKVLKGLL